MVGTGLVTALSGKRRLEKESDLGMSEVNSFNRGSNMSRPGSREMPKDT